MVKISELRRFNGKTFIFAYYRHSKEEARECAKAERLKGWKARVVKIKIGMKTYWDIYLSMSHDRVAVAGGILSNCLTEMGK